MDDLQKKLGHRFLDQELLKLALRHKSVGSLNNERLEFLGDSILNFVVAEMLFTEFKTMDEGRMSKVRANLVCEDSLFQIAEKIGVREQLRFVPGIRGTELAKSMMADALEALFAAVYLDAGMDKAKALIRQHMWAFASSDSANLGKDPKTELQERLQARGMDRPVYQLIGDYPSAELRYEASCAIVAVNVHTKGRGETRKKAEAAAAAAALKAFR